MKIKNFKINSEDQVIVKITGEILRAFHIEEANNFEPVDFEKFEIFNEVKGETVKTRLTLKSNGKVKKFSESENVNPAERRGAEVHRLIKKNLYRILTQDLKLDGVPYGIMHGVRPTKIVHRWLRGGFGVTKQGVFDRDKIARRLRADYLTNYEKANLLTEVAIRQIPILKTGGEKIIGVYVGIPFCVTRCLYCSFPSNVLPDDEKVADFMQVLTKDIDAAAAEIQRYNFKVQSIYIGGGTPTALPEKFFTEMLEKVTSAFYSESVEEFTVEAGRPDTITAEKISAMKNCHVTRVSVNPQTMQQKTLDRIGRQHSVEEIYTAFKNLREGTNFQINMDLILGLPGETLSDVKDSLEKVLALNPDDITLHALAIKRGSQLQTQLADEISTLDEFDLPEDAEVRKMGDLAEKMLRGKKYLPYYLYRQGYISGQIENIGYCKRGAEGIYNVQIMDERQTILGVGAAATTKVPDNENLRLQTSFNAKDLITYLRDVDKYIENRSNILAEIYKTVEENLTVEKPVEVAENPVVETSENISVETSENPSEISYDNAFNQFLEDIIFPAEKILETEEISKMTYEKAFNQFLEDIIYPAENIAAETVENVAVETSENVAAETSENIAVETSENIAVETSENIAVETSENIAVETSENIAVETSEKPATTPKKKFKSKKGKAKR